MFPFISPPLCCWMQRYVLANIELIKIVHKQSKCFRFYISHKKLQYCNSPNMNILSSIIVTIFQITCFGIAAYMIYSQIEAFLSNKDLSVVSYQSFNQKPENTYPTLSMCAKGYSNRPFVHTKRKYQTNFNANADL